MKTLRTGRIEENQVLVVLLTVLELVDDFVLLGYPQILFFLRFCRDSFRGLLLFGFRLLIVVNEVVMHLFWGLLDVRVYN